MNRIAALSLPARQRGVVLVISLLLLLILTVIGLAATRTTALEERMTANQNDQEVAFQAAEAALRYGEAQLSAAAQPDFAANTAGAFTQVTMPSTINPLNTDPSFWGPSSTLTEPYGNGIITSNQNLILTGTGTGQTSYRSPRYYIVFSTQPAPGKGRDLKFNQQLQQKNVYFIYAQGYGQSPNTTVTLEAVDTF